MFSKEVTQHKPLAAHTFIQQGKSGHTLASPDVAQQSNNACSDLLKARRVRNKQFKEIDTWIGLYPFKPGKGYINENDQPLTGIVARDTKNTVKITICRHGTLRKTYTYDKSTPAPKHPMVSWKNLTMCGGFRLADEKGQWTDRVEAIADAVFGGSKPVGDLTYLGEHDTKFMTDAARKVGLEVFNYQRIDAHSTTYKMLIGVQAPICDVFDLSAIAAYYKAVAPWTFDLIRKKFKHICQMTPVEALSQYDFFNPPTTSDWVVTGMLLGYPFESTADGFR